MAGLAGRAYAPLAAVSWGISDYVNGRCRAWRVVRERAAGRGVMGGSRIKSTADLVAAAGRAAAGHTAAEQVRSSALIDASPDAIVVVGADGRLVVFNRAAEELTGWRSGEVLGNVMVEVLIPEPARPAVVGGMRAYLESGDRGEFVGRVRMPILCADGTQRMTELTPVPVTIEGEVHFCGFLRDISDLEQANAALRESENRFRLLSQLAPVGIVQTDLNGMYTFANVRWCELTGMTMSQALSASWPAGIHPDDVRRLEQEWQRATAMDTELRTDCRLQAGSGSEVWAHISMIPVLDGDGQRSGFLGAVTNVSERKRAEAEKERLLNAERAARRSLADQTERLNGLVAAAIPGILMDDEHGRITQLNQSFCDLLGISAAASELIGTSTTRIAIRIQRVFADPGEFLRRARELVANRLPVALDEIACADGRTLEWDFAPVFVDGCYRGNLWGVADATERTALAEQRERLLAAGRARLSTTSRLMSRSRRARRCARIRCGCSRCSATCCRTRSSTPGRAGRSGSRPATTGSGGRYGWRITAWASRRTSWAAFSTGSSGRPTRGRPACRAPAWGWRSSRRSPSCTAAPSRSAAWWNTAPPSPSTCRYIHERADPLHRGRGGHRARHHDGAAPCRVRRPQRR